MIFIHPSRSIRGGFFRSPNPKGNRVQMTTNVSPRLVEIVNRAARQTDQKTAEFIRGAIVQRLKAEGHDLAAALQD
jgi:hypothetical protein